MKILAINGSPRGRKSNTDRILQPFILGAADMGAICETVYAVDLNIKECAGCYACWRRTPGVCIYNDDMVQLVGKIRQADIMVWATPVYHFGMNVWLRRIVERTLPLNLPYMVKKGGRFSHPARFEDGPSKTVLIANCGFPDRSNFDQLVGVFHKIVGGEGLAATILCGGGELLGIEDFQGYFERYIKAVYQAGCEIVKHGHITKETSEILEVPLIAPETLVSFANAQWRVEGENPPSLEEALGLLKNTPSAEEFAEPIPLSFPSGRDAICDQMSGMALKYQPNKIPGLNTAIQFVVTGKEPGNYFLKIENSECHAFIGKHASPHLTIHTPSEVWLAISRSELNGKEALLQGKYYMEGNIGLMVKFPELFKA